MLLASRCDGMKESSRSSADLAGQPIEDPRTESGESWERKYEK